MWGVGCGEQLSHPTSPARAVRSGGLGWRLNQSKAEEATLSHPPRPGTKYENNYSSISFILKFEFEK